jgi:hypothetical protein
VSDGNPHEENVVEEPVREINLSEKFPDLQPIKSTPSLFTANGCGFAMSGSRDHDEETGTYIKTHCFTLILIPLIALRAYRVADAEQGWYFLGREPISAFARVWNTLLVFSIFVGSGIGYWAYHTSTPDYIAAQKLEEADELAENAEWVTAAKKYAEVARMNVSVSPTARSRIDQLYEKAEPDLTADDSVELMKFGEQLNDEKMPLK